ncbi:MAG TPA: AMP-binding protein [Myxococcota bacterium]|jgi:acyl-CoA synthetase (AMP-forming)/AMP-acid ligase II|nr:AMP-binding protein [Myxococcota bacterium]
MSGTSLLSTPATLRLHSATWAEALERVAASGCHLIFVERNREPAVVPYRALLERARAYAHHLLSHGLERGGRVMILLPTGEDWVAAFFGTLLAGGVPVPVGPTFSIGGLDKHAETLRHIATSCAAHHFFGTARVEQYMTQIFAPGALRAFINPGRDLGGGAAPGAGTAAAAHAFPAADGDSLGMIQYTSGTTSMPKGVELTQRALLSNAYDVGERLGMGPAEVGVSWLPLFHDMGLIGALLTAVYWHYPLVLMTPELFLMQPRRWMEVVAEQHATMSVAPNFAYKTAVAKMAGADAAALDLGRWRIALNGSESVLPSTLREFSVHFAAARFDPHAFLPVYGMAENCLAATFPDVGTLFDSDVVDRARLEVERVAAAPADPGGAGAREIVSVGYPLSGQSVAIEGEDGRVLDERQVGEIIVQGPCLMRGYHDNPEATARTLRGGWLHTGDLGYVSRGRLFVTGRAKEMIIVRGRNYYPHDIEQLVAGVVGDSSAGSAAVGLFDENAGTEQLGLLVEVESHSRLGRTHDAIAAAINNDLIAALGIRAERIAFVKNRTLPRTTSGKLQRTACRQRLIDGSFFPAE